MQPYFFPYIGYFQLIAASDIFVIQDAVQYIKGGWINRNRILDRKGEEVWITLPVAAASHKLLILDREYLLQIGSARRVLRQIENAYLKAPYFKDAFPLVQEITKCEEPNVATFNSRLLKSMAVRLGLRTRFVRSSELPTTPELRGQARVIDLCRRLGATCYVNPIGGRDLYEANVFRDCGVSLGFLRTTIEPRQARFPYLSIIHTLMTESDAAISDLLASYRIEPS